MVETDEDTPLVSANALQTYCNGFSLNLSNADVSLHLLWNGTHTSTVSMSFTTAKTLMIGLKNMVAELEKESGREIMDIGYVSDVIGRMSHQSNEN